MNYLQLRERLGRRLGITRDEAQNADEWEMMGETLNEGIIDILSRTRLHVKCLSLALIVGENEYELADEVLRLYNVRQADGDLLQYDTSDLARMQGEHAFAIVGYNRLQIGWEPSAGGELEAWYTPRPMPLTEANHDPALAQYGNIPPEFHPVIVDYASWHLADSSGDQGSQRGEAYRVRYEGKTGTGEIGSGLGRIKLAINRRVSGGSATHRLARTGSYITSDVHTDYWQG